MLFRSAVSNNLEDFNLSGSLTTAIYRTVQEALTNITRHACASTVKIILQSNDGKVLVEITDDGKGIKDEDMRGMKSFGLVGMRERVHLLKGKLSIKGYPGKGTTVLAEIPL